MTQFCNNQSRRTFLKAAAVTGALGTISTSGRAQAMTIELGGDTGGWVGRSPESIAETRNPTLELEPGQTYEIVWENVDGARHNVVILGENRNRLVRSELIAEEGATQTVEFEATEEMSEYLCEVHPETMVGDIEIAGDDAGQETPTETTTEEDETDTEETDGAEQEETDVPEARDPEAAVEGTVQADPEVNEEAVAEFQEEDDADGEGNRTDTTEGEETDVPEARDPDEAETGTPESEPEVPEREIDPDEIDVRVFINGTEVGNETGPESRRGPSSSRSGFETLGALGGLAGVGAYLFSREEGDE